VALIITDVSEDLIASISVSYEFVPIQELTTSLCNQLALVSYEFVPIQELTTSLCNQLALVHPEDGGDTIVRNVASYKSHTVLSPRR
jgi:hypothetical protein